MRRIKKMRPSYASVTATIALVLALGMGGAYAATKIGSKDVAKGAVKSKHVKDDSLKGVDVNESTLGRVPDAGQAASADRATRAETAGSAESAEAATRADIASAVAPDAVTSAGILDGEVESSDLGKDAVTGANVASRSLAGSDIAQNSLGSTELQDDTIGKDEIIAGSVGAYELGNVTTATSPGVEVTAGTPRGDYVMCPSGHVLLAGGFAWRDDEPSTIVASAPSESSPHRIWEVRGLVSSGSNVLYAWAHCLRP